MIGVQAANIMKSGLIRAPNMIDCGNFPALRVDEEKQVSWSKIHEPP